MKIEALARPGLVALSVVGIAATALLGFAAGVAVSRDPEAVRRTARRVASAAATALERATLLAAQARERVGDLWAEAREAAVADVDEADFKRAAAGAAAVKTPRAASATTAAAGVGSAPIAKPARKRARRPRKLRVIEPKTTGAAADATSDQD